MHLAAPEALVPPEMKTRACFSWDSAMVGLSRLAGGSGGKIDVPCAYFPKAPAHSHIVGRHFTHSDMSNGVLTL